MVHVTDRTSYNLSLLLTVILKWGWIDAGAGDFASILRGNDKKLDSMTATSTRVRSGRSVAQFSWVRSVGFEKDCARCRIKANRVEKAFPHSFVCSTAVESTPKRFKHHSTAVGWTFQIVYWFRQISDVYCWDLVISPNLIRDYWLLTNDYWPLLGACD